MIGVVCDKVGVMAALICSLLLSVSLSSAQAEKLGGGSPSEDQSCHAKNKSDVIKHIRPSKQLVEVCEGEQFLLICPENSVIKLAKNVDIQFGRNGAWENRTRCGSGNVEHCHNIKGKKLFLSPCSGKSYCLIDFR